MREYKSAKMSGKEGDVVRRNLGVLMAKSPLATFLSGRGEVLRCYLWVLALHWSRGWWYDGKCVVGPYLRYKQMM
jgi:hypothetical protein